MDDPTPKPIAMEYDEAQAKITEYFKAAHPYRMLIAYSMDEDGSDDIITAVKAVYGVSLVHYMAQMFDASARNDTSEYQNSVIEYNDCFDEMIAIILARGAHLGIENNTLAELLSQIKFDEEDE